MTQTEELIRARFMEAADVERRLPKVRGPRAGSYWPGYGFDKEEREGWTDEDTAEDRQRWAARRDVTAAELSRYAEVIGWTIDHIHHVEMRRLVWMWAACQVIPGRSFVAACDRKGLVRSTAYARLERLWKRLDAEFRKTGLLLRFPLAGEGGQNSGSEAHIGVEYSQAAQSASAIPHTPYRAEQLSDLPDERDLSWAQRKWEREARHRKKLGLDAA